ncbi:MAG: hypothetical protein KAG43_10405, partial [Candidatus Marithrix sp.]|nr:hypothetical protein [Candidatus Marithrix sp.]
MESNESIAVRQIEKLVYQQNFDGAIVAIIKILKLAESRGGLKFNDESLEYDFLNEYTCLASAFTAFFANPKVLLSPDDFQALAKYKKHLLGIFELSGFGGTDHMQGAIGTQT